MRFHTLFLHGFWNFKRGIVAVVRALTAQGIKVMTKKAPAEYPEIKDGSGSNQISDPYSCITRSSKLVKEKPIAGITGSGEINSISGSEDFYHKDPDAKIWIRIHECVIKSV